MIKTLLEVAAGVAGGVYVADKLTGASKPDAQRTSEWEAKKAQQDAGELRAYMAGIAKASAAYARAKANMGPAEQAYEESLDADTEQAVTRFFEDMERVQKNGDVGYEQFLIRVAENAPKGIKAMMESFAGELRAHHIDFDRITRINFDRDCAEQARQERARKQDEDDYQALQNHYRSLAQEADREANRVANLGNPNYRPLPVRWSLRRKAVVAAFTGLTLWWAVSSAMDPTPTKNTDTAYAHSLLGPASLRMDAEAAQDALAAKYGGKPIAQATQQAAQAPLSDPAGIR